MSGGFIEQNDEAFAAQLNNFSVQIEELGSDLGFTTEEIASAKADSIYWSYYLKSDYSVEKYADDFKKSKELLRKGGKEEIYKGLPTPPALGVEPHVVAANIQHRFSLRAKKAKASPNYTKGIGENLGIEATHQAFYPNLGKPQLTISFNVGHPVIKYTKGKYDGIALYKDSGDGFVLLATALKPTYTDKTALPTKDSGKVWKYKAIYIWQSEETGKWSDEASVVVMG